MGIRRKVVKQRPIPREYGFTVTITVSTIGGSEQALRKLEEWLRLNPLPVSFRVIYLTSPLEIGVLTRDSE